MGVALSESPAAWSEQAVLSALGPQLASGRGALSLGWGGVAKVTPRWAGYWRWPGHHERPEAQLHLRRLWRVGVSARPSVLRVLIGCGGPVVGRSAEAEANFHPSREWDE